MEYETGCPKCGGPEISVALLVDEGPVLPPERKAALDKRLAKVEPSHTLICVRCLHSRVGNAGAEWTNVYESPVEFLEREQAAETARRSKYERAMRGEW